MKSKIKITSINKDKIKNLFSEENAIFTVTNAFLLSVVTLSTITAISESIYESKQRKIDDSLSSIVYQTNNDSESLSIKDLYYVQKEEEVFLCNRVNNTNENRTTTSIKTHKFVIPVNNTYIYKDINTGNTICTSTDSNIIIHSVLSELKDDLLEENISGSNYNQDHINNLIEEKVKIKN